MIGDGEQPGLFLLVQDPVKAWETPRSARFTHTHTSSVQGRQSTACITDKSPAGALVTGPCGEDVREDGAGHGELEPMRNHKEVLTPSCPGCVNNAFIQSLSPCIVTDRVFNNDSDALNFTLSLTDGR